LIQLLQISVSILFFGNKVFVLLGKRTGWLLGALAATLAFFYFYQLKLYVYTTLEAGLVILMLYGFFPKRSKKIEFWIRVLIGTIMLGIGYYAFSGYITIIEFLSSIILLWGTYLLANKKLILGWSAYIVAHGFATILGCEVGQIIFAVFQLASVIVAIIGLAISLRPSQK
jgi:hypothetical protein